MQVPPRKRRASPSGEQTFQRAQHVPNRSREAFANKNPHKKPKLVPQVVVPRLFSQQLKARAAPNMPNYEERHEGGPSFQDDDDQFELSSLSSIPSTPSRPGTPVPSASEIRPRSPSRELTYLDDDINPMAQAKSLNEPTSRYSPPSSRPRALSMNNGTALSHQPLATDATSAGRVLRRVRDPPTDADNQQVGSSVLILRM